MIDTLFYFVDTEQEYRRQMQGENGLPGISPTTIVFVGDSREIYVNGKGYGKTSTNGLLASSEFDQWKGQLNERIDNVISNAASENEEARQKAEEDLEAAMTLVQSMMDTSAEEMAATIQSVRNQIQQAKTELQENIDSANENADEILSALTTFLGTIRNELETSIRDAITNANGRTIWSELNTTNEGITAMTNRIDQSLNPDGSIKETTALQAIIRNGVENNLAVTDIQSKWAVLDENQDVIEWVASGFKSQAHNEGGLAAVFATAQNDTLNAIASMKTEIEQDVAGNYVANADVATHVRNTVKTDLGLQETDSLSAIALQSNVDAATTTITNRLNTVDQTTGALQTSLSQVSSVANAGFARVDAITSLGENDTWIFNESKLDLAVAGILTTSGSSSAAQVHVLSLADIAEAHIAAQIDNATSAVLTRVESVEDLVDGEIVERKQATATLAAQIDDVDGKLSTAKAGIEARVTSAESTITQLSEWQNDEAGYFKKWQAGVITTTNKDGAVASLIADGTSTMAAIVAAVNDDDSAIKISADHIFLDANKTNTIRSKFTSLDNTIGGHTTSIAALNTDASEKAATLDLLTTWKNTNGEYLAGIASEAKLGSAMATLVAKAANVRSEIALLVDDEVSTLSLSADKVFIDGQLNVSIKSYVNTELNNAIDGVEDDIDALGNTVAGHTSSIASLGTRATKTESSIEAITTWKDGFVKDYASGLLTTAGLDGAVAELFAENATSGSKSKVTAMVDGKLSTLTLSADKVLIEGQETTIKNYFDSGLLTATNTLQGNINSLSNTVAGHTTSINSINSKADANAASISLLSTWANEFEGSYTAGLVTEATLGSAMATIIAENDDGIQAKITTAVKNNASEIELNADQIKLSGSTLANRIEATQGTIGGVTIANNDIHSANNKFKVTSDGKLTATDATITGAITATSLSLSGTKIQTNQIDGLSAIATSGDYNDLSNKPTIPTLPENVITADQVYVDDVVSSDGVTTRTIHVGSNKYTSIVDGNFVKTNIGLGNANSGSFVQISNTGLLEAHNAVIYGTIYANGGQIAGFSIQDTSNTVPAANIHYGVTSMSDTSHDGVYVGTNGIRLGKGKFSVSDKGALTATDATITGTINATALNLVGSTKIQPSQINATIPTKLSQLTNDKNFIDNTALSGYALAANVPTSISQLTGSAGILYQDNISTKEETVNGVKVKTITVGNKSYTTISDNNGFIYTNVGYGTQNANHTSSYFQVSTEGLLTANNAVIYGTVYATNGSFSGTVESASGHIGGIKINNGSISSDNNKFSLTSAGVLTATDATIKGSIETGNGKIGGFTIGPSYIRNGLTDMSDSSNNGVYIGTDGIKLGSNDLFSVTKQGILTAKNANITGTINATTLNLGSTVTMPKGDGTTESVSVNDLRNDKLPTVAQTGKFADLSDYATAVPSIAKTGKIANASDYSSLPTIAKIGHGKFSELSDYSTAVPSIAKTGKLAEASDYSSLPAIAKIGGGKLSDLSGYSSFPTYLKELRVPTKSEVGVTKLSDLTDDINVVKSSEVTVTATTNADGLTENTISIDGKTFKSIVGEGFVRTNIGLGNTNNTYVEISSDGLLTAKNAVIYGTIYATRGQIGGINISDNGIASSNGNFSLTSTGQLTATGAAISGTITATDGTIGGYTIDSDKLYISEDRGSTASNLLGFSYSDLTINKNTSYKNLKGDPYATQNTLLSLFIQSPESYFPSIQAVQRSILEYSEFNNGGILDPVSGSVIDEGDTTSVQSTTKNIVQFSPIGFRTAVDTVVKEYPDGHPEQITTKSQTFTETNRIDTNGAGMLGKEGIKWTSAGAFTVSSGFAKSVFDSMSDGLSNTTSTGAGVGKVTTKKTVTPTYDSIKLQKEVTTASNGTTTTTAMEILPDAIKVTKNGTTSTGVTQSFKVSAKGYLNGSWQTYDLTLKFTNGILTGYDKNNFPGSTI